MSGSAEMDSRILGQLKALDKDFYGNFKSKTAVFS